MGNDHGSGSETSAPGWVDRLREWIRSEIPAAQAELLQETLEHLCDLFDAPRALIVWEEPDEPWVNLASRTGPEGLIWKQVAPSSFQPLVDDEVSDGSFWHDGTEGGPAIHSELCKEFSISSTLSFAINGEDVTGRIFVLDLEDASGEHFLIGELASAIVEERFSRALQGPAEEGVGERVRAIARDLHDGLLQSFTGIVLQLEALLPVVQTDPEEARKKITELEAALMKEQRELRSYLESITEKKKAEEVDFDMTARLRDLAHRYQDQWGVEIEYRRDTLDPVIRRALGWETYRIITEAITNATRHGRAKRVRVTLSTHEDLLRIVVDDDGEGFPFRGRYDARELLEKGMAPNSLTERIHSLNGEITIESTDDGTRLEITIPIGWIQP